MPFVLKSDEDYVFFYPEEVELLQEKLLYEFSVEDDTVVSVSWFDAAGDAFGFRVETAEFEDLSLGYWRDQCLGAWVKFVRHWEHWTPVLYYKTIDRLDEMPDNT